ncbi:hypothetical protein BJ508DRAFT_418772 [Ascobolus immersus RN42]|uniref:Uncharacterized protein n=1 Tax=Ascobolus immersus RN42 TaxID=1160509 RepID=A0A3N4HNJ5_ASCIM|nr:hypothetical protein BJ508DRAFT_418772 [Ascobolus immersus RN42]
MFKFLLPILLVLTTIVTAIPLRANFYNVPPTLAYRRTLLPSSHIPHPQAHYERKRASTLHTLIQEAQPQYQIASHYPRRHVIPLAGPRLTSNPSHSNLAELHARLETLKGMESRRYKEVKRALGRVRTRAAVEGMRKWVEEEIFQATVARVKRRDFGEDVLGW